MIQIKNLTKRYGPLVAVDDLSLEVSVGEVLGFLEPNGAGKSTTMKMVTGFLSPDAGTVTVGGDSVSDAPLATKARIGYLPEGAPLYGDMTPRAFLAFIAEIRGLKGAKRRQAVDLAVQRTALDSALEKPIETLSKGFKRRVGLAQAILHDPEVLILDEPTDGLDPNQKHDVRELIRSMARDKVVVLSTHILEEMEAVCTRAVIISAGKLVFDGSPDQLIARSRLHNALVLSIRAVSSDDARSALQTLSGVASVELLEDDGDWSTIQVLPAGGALLAREVSEMSRTRGWELGQLSVERGRLDEVFRHITQGGA